MNTEKYLFRRQYVLGPRFINSLSGWKNIKITDRLFSTVHPDLSVAQVHSNNNFIILLGYMLDPYNPSHDDSQIIKNIIEIVNSADEVFDHVAAKCGRFVMIVKINQDFRIFNDAGGMRQVFYHVDSFNNLWCASQPTIIAKQLGLNIDENIRKDLYKSFLFRKSPDHWYPGKISLFKEIFHLTPNHYLDFNNNNCIRYWPFKPLKPISIPECVEKTSKLLRGIFESACSRFNNLTLGISSGLDSRLLLAASKVPKANIHYFTQTNREVDYENPDIGITSALLQQFGLKHSILVLPNKLDKDFDTFFRRNVFTARTIKGLNAYSLFKNFHAESQDTVVIYGNLHEITKRDRYRWPRLPKILIRGSTLTEMAQMSRSKVALNEFTMWFDSVRRVTDYNVNILDLMHWEQRVGNWAAMTFSEYDIAFETLCPYNCRQYIEYMLRVPFKFRTMPDYKVHHELIRNLWPETLRFNITTVNRETNKQKYEFINFLYRTNLYDILKYLYIMMYRRFR
jgi:hypothetical protein